MSSFEKISMGDYLKAFLVGICASAPIGPVAIYILQRSLSKGHIAGFFSSLGTCVVDTLYACIALLALGYVQGFLDKHNEIISIVGGALVFGIGISLMLGNPFKKVEFEQPKSYSVKDALKSGLLALSNPGAIVMTFTLMAFFGLEPMKATDWRIAPLVLMCAAGCVTYWFCFAGFFSLFRNRFRISTIVWINRICGAVVAILGLAVAGDGLYNVLILGKPLFALL